MLKKIVLFILIFNCFTIYSQNVDGYVVTNENDTIQCKILINKNRSNIHHQLDLAHLRRKVTILNINNEKKTYRPFELISINFKKNDENFKFISVQDDDYKRFFREINNGKISHLVIYEESLSQYSHVDMGFNYLYKNDILTDMYIGNVREVVGDLIKDYPALYKDWKDKKYKTDQYLEVIKLYNEHYKNKKD